MNINQHTSVGLTLFCKIPAQLSDGDKGSFLAILRAHGELHGEYAYLEIGSHLGGSIAPVLLDQKCKKIYSIDKRPAVVPDDTGKVYHYPMNSSARMMANLRAIHSSADEKVTCFDGDTASVAITELSLTPSICFIDGEHTDAVAYRDYQFCRKAIQNRGTLVFHDANTLYLTLQRIINDLNSEDFSFEAYCLADSMFVISLGTPKISRDEGIMVLMRQGGGYLPSLVINDHYRRFKNRKLFKWLRTLFGFLR
jgi:hypothetical protein